MPAEEIKAMKEKEKKAKKDAFFNENFFPDGTPRYTDRGKNFEVN